MKGTIVEEIRLSVVKRKEVPQASAELRSGQRNLFIFCQLPQHDSFTHLWTPEGQRTHVCLPNCPSMASHFHHQAPNVAPEPSAQPDYMGLA